MKGGKGGREGQKRERERKCHKETITAAGFMSAPVPVATQRPLLDGAGLAGAGFPPASCHSGSVTESGLVCTPGLARPPGTVKTPRVFVAPASGRPKSQPRFSPKTSLLIECALLHRASLGRGTKGLGTSLQLRGQLCVLRPAEAHLCAQSVTGRAFGVALSGGGGQPNLILIKRDLAPICQ